MAKLSHQKTNTTPAKISLDQLCIGAGRIKVESADKTIQYFVPRDNESSEIEETLIEAYETAGKTLEIPEPIPGYITTEFKDLETGKKYVRAYLNFYMLILNAAAATQADSSERTEMTKQHHEYFRKKLEDSNAVNILESNEKFWEWPLAKIVNLDFDSMLSYVKNLNNCNSKVLQSKYVRK